MNQKNLVSLIILDVIVIFFAAGLITLRYKSLTGFAEISLAEFAARAQKSTPASQAQPAKTIAQETQKKGNSGKARNIGFSIKTQR